jgi:predicted transcriptional regulator of viral defense system
MPEPGRETGKCGRFLDQPLAELALKQHGVFGLDQLAELGLTDTAVHKRVATGRLHRIHHGVYALVPRELLKREGLYMAAVLACGPGAVLSHRSAARLLELRNHGYTRIEVTVARRSGRTHSGVAVHRSTTLTDRDITIVENIPTTTVARTLFDLAEFVNARQLERAFDQADRMDVLNLGAINDQLTRNPTRRAAKVVRNLLNTHYIGSTPTDNEFEDAFLGLTRSLGLPDPEVQYYIDPGDGDGPLRADFAWPDRRIAVETDGRKTHGTRQAFENDRRRDQRLIAAGWRVIRITWRQLTQRPHELRPVLLTLLGAPPASPNGQAKPGVAGAPDRGRPQTQRAGGSTS